LIPTSGVTANERKTGFKDSHVGVYYYYDVDTNGLDWIGLNQISWLAETAFYGWRVVIGAGIC